MNETPTQQAEAGKTAPATPEAKPRAKKEEGSFFVFLIKLLVIVLIFRSFIFSPFSIPSESMLPRLENGDHLLASKWSYGFSNNSLPLGIRPFPEGRLFASQPERGDIVIFKHPIDGSDYIKRVIGLPGDQVQMVGGVLFLNGEPVEKERIEDFEIAVSPNTSCAEQQFVATGENGEAICRYPQFREQLPNGKSYNVLDFGMRPQDDTLPRVVPDGMMFLMGDNRDNSLDSRFPAEPGRGIGLVPQDNLVGGAAIMIWSTDGGSEWIKPWTWFTAARWTRLGGTF